MFGDLLKGFVNKEEATIDVLTDTLTNLSAELNKNFDEFFVMIKPTTKEFKFRCDVYILENNLPKWIREITVKEIVGE